MATLARLVRELDARRRERAHRRKRIARTPKGAQRKRLVRRQRKVIRRIRVLREAIVERRRWGGSRAVTNEVIRVVGRRAPVTSRKRAAHDPLSLANPGSDHNEANKWSDAVDFGVANAYSLAREIAAKLGGQWERDYDSFVIERNGRRFRVQIIAGTHGTGPHLHVGVRRIG